MYGRLTVVCGPMYAGKTTELLKRILWARNGQRKNVVVVKPACDDRYSETEIVSHDGLKVEAKSITDWDQVAQFAAGADMVCLDEVQFFEPSIVEHIRDCLIVGTDVVVSGLDMDWQGNAFPITSQLMAMADEVIKDTAYCTVCGQAAPKTHKKSGAGASVEIGGADKYEARCNTHWGL